jgi:hypothetical protein
LDQEKTYKWIQDRLRELNAGTITEVDFHQLETLAKEDPFVADALEGYQLHPDFDHTESLDSLAKKIKPFKLKRRRWLIPNLTVTAVAASLILIVGFYAVMTRISTRENKDLAGAASEHQLGIEKSGDTFAIVPDKENSIVAAEPDQPIAAAEATRSEIQRKSVEKPSSAKADKKEIAATSRTRSQPADETYAIEDTKTKGVSPPYGNETDQNILDKQPAVLAETEAKDAGYYANQMNPQVMAQRVSGKVTSVDGDPLIGVNLLVKGTNLVTVSDLGGKFELYLPNGESQVDITYGGFENAEVTFTPGQENVHIQLKTISSQELNAVSGSAAPASRAQNASPKMSTVTKPADENILFVDYLKTNSKFPLAENLTAPAKIVTLEFFIGADGQPGQVKVIQSSGEKNLDDEAVRLIRKGPDWDCGEAKYPCKVKYSIYFRA